MKEPFSKVYVRSIVVMWSFALEMFQFGEGSNRDGQASLARIA
jgi:hypothetical protein